MIEKFEDLELDTCDTLESIELKLQEKLSIDTQTMKEALSNFVVQNAENLSKEFVSLAPFGDYSKLLEDSKDIMGFLKSSAHKPEYWKLAGVRAPEEGKNLLTFNFSNTAMDESDIFEGFVYVSFEGKIKHVFAQGE